MKFGKEFQKQMVPEWIEAYMDYNGLKRILREILHHKQSRQQVTPLRALHHGLTHRILSGFNVPNGNKPIDGDIEEGGENEVMFFRKLDEELNKVNEFYRDQVEEVMTEAALLNKQIDAFIALQIKVVNPDFGHSNLLARDAADVATAMPLRSMSRGATLLRREHTDSIVEADMNCNNQGQDFADGPGVSPIHTTNCISDFREEVNNTFESPISTIKGVLIDSKEEELRFEKEVLRKVEERLKLVLIELYRKLRHLNQYSFMNLAAFSKIMKYEKFASRKASRSYMKKVDNSYLGSSDEVIGLLERVEATFIKHFSNSIRREAMKLLRPKTKRERHSVTFFSGFFSGCSIALVVGIVLRIEAQDLMGKEKGTSYMRNIFPLYRHTQYSLNLIFMYPQIFFKNNIWPVSLFAYTILHMLMYASNTYFWSRYRINYPFIFGFKQGTEFGYREIFFLSTGLTVLASACFLANLHLDMGSRMGNYKTVTQLIPLGLLVVVLSIIFCPFNIIYRSSRFFFIKCLFRCLCAPFYQVTLPEFFLADNLTSQLELYVCYYGLGEYSRRQNKCHRHGVYNSFYFVFAVIPFWLRFLQCFRQFCEDKDVMHACDSLKYILTIIAVLIRMAFELNKGTTWMVLALLSSAIATLMNTYWDIVVDWGLLQMQSKKLYLRDKLLVSHNSVYFAAMILNVLLRLAWMQLVLEFNWHPIHKMTMITVISCLEIIRRGIWSFFRLENEHLNNVGKFRAFESVPLPFTYYDEDDNADDDTNKDN